MACIEELHEQLGSVALDRLDDFSIRPAQLKELHTRLGQLADSSQAIQDFPLFQAVTAEPTLRRLGSATSRSDSSTQVFFCCCLPICPSCCAVVTQHCAALPLWAKEYLSTISAAHEYSCSWHIRGASAELVGYTDGD